MSVGRTIWTLCLLLCSLLFISQPAAAQRETTFSIVQDLKTNRCNIVARRATTTAEQTVLGEFGSVAEAQYRLKQILICGNRETHLTTAERCWREAYGYHGALMIDDRRQQRMSNRRSKPSMSCIESNNEARRLTQIRSDRIKAR